MVSVLSASALPPTFNAMQPVQLNELTNLRDAVEPFTKMVTQHGDSTVRLHCTIPTWSAASELCLDLHDLHDLRTRFLLFIHNLLESLRSSGIPASYALAPSNSPLCLVCALPSNLGPSKAKNTAIEVFQNAKFNKRDNVLLADLEYGPALVIT